jgi:predicted nucleic acid-binding protein
LRFWDSSAVVPLLVRQELSAFVEQALGEDGEVVIWWGTPVECISAITRLQREGGIESNHVDDALLRLRGLTNTWHEVEPQLRLRELAERLLRRHPLRSADSLQLAAALMACEERPEGVLFVCLDKRLAEAAGREGFRLVTRLGQS